MSSEQGLERSNGGTLDYQAIVSEARTNAPHDDVNISIPSDELDAALQQDFISLTDDARNSVNGTPTSTARAVFSMQLPRSLRIRTSASFHDLSQKYASQSSAGSSKPVSQNSAGSYQPTNKETLETLENNEPPQDAESYKYVYINDRENRNSRYKYPSNSIQTSKYTWWSFVPVFLYLTFSKVANIYFLMIGIFQMIPDISPTGGIPLQFLPLSIVIFIDAIFAIFEDYKRHKADKQANSAPVHIYNRQQKSFVLDQWSDLQVGDIVKIMNYETIPADLFVLAVGRKSDSTREVHLDLTGICYVETKSLDGETNLKLREAVNLTIGESENEENLIESFRGVLKSELPNGDINTYSGSLFVENEVYPGIPVELKNMLLRGTKLRNTNFIYGLVVNTGVDTKILKSSGDEFPVKISTIDQMTNHQVGYLVLLLLLMCLISAIGNEVWKDDNSPWYLMDPYNFAQAFFSILATLATMVPITLYVSITVVKGCQVYFMHQDLNMYSVETDSPMQARNMQLNEQLGQISHIFSDKTGTLTCNKMDFRKCSINGKSYGKGTTLIGLAAKKRNDYKAIDDSDEEENSEQHQSFDEKISIPAAIPNVDFDGIQFFRDLKGKSGKDQQTKIENFLLHLALCHSVLVEEGSDNTRTFSASSPDEQALVSAAKYFGYEFYSRVPGLISVQCPDGCMIDYNLLAIFEFNSTRKRMTVVVQEKENPLGPVKVFCKGADNIIFQLLDESMTSQTLRNRTSKHIEKFARDGLRTLVLAFKELTIADWTSFHERYRQALGDISELELKQQGKKNKIDEMQAEMEQKLILLGATAIEDRLQDGVPETMAKLAQAGINLWVLTGDMEETAINIGYACQLLNNEMIRIVINHNQFTSKDSILRFLDEKFHEYEKMFSADAAGASDTELALVIDGASLALILSEEDSLHFLRFALLCKVVIACRVSPQQKALLVALVKDNCQGVRTLAIGDGANDVPMIQAAHVGVGIIGEEGLQAVNNSDYAIGQFRFLLRLLIVHGRWNYYRIAHLILFTFYKNVAYCGSLLWYILSPSAYSGTMVFSPFIQQGYNLFFTAVPIVVYSILDQDISAEMALKYPQVYYTGPEDSIFNFSLFWRWILLAAVDSVGILYISTYGAGYVFSDSRSTEYTILASIAWTTLCVVVSIRFALLVHSWQWIEVFGVLLSILLIYLFQWFTDMITWPPPDYNMYSFPYLFSEWKFWLLQLLAIVMILGKDIFWKGYRRNYRPEFFHLVQEVDKYQLADTLSDWKPPKRKKRILAKEIEDVGTAGTETHKSPGHDSAYRGFAFDQPASVINWIMSSANIVKPDVADLTDQILTSSDPVIFENERFQPFVGYGSTRPGHLLLTDRNRWSDRSGKHSSMKISTKGLQINLDVEGADKDGWVYASDFKRFHHEKIRKHRGLVRRRQWIRKPTAPTSTGSRGIPSNSSQ